MISANVPNRVRAAIYRREGYACALCGDPRHLHIHHAVSRSKGGGNTPRNLICICRYCHSMAHGVNLVPDVWLSAEECQQYAAEVRENCDMYLSDMYAGSFPDAFTCFDPYDMADYSDPDTVTDTLDEIRVCILARTRGRW